MTPSETEALLQRAAAGHAAARRLLERAPAQAEAEAGERERPPPAEAEDEELLALEEKLVWILGSPRSGSSWLMEMLDEHESVVVDNEPYLGVHLVPLGEAVPEGEYLRAGQRAGDPHYLLAERYLPALMPLLRRLALSALREQVVELGGGRDCRRIVLKEPNGSHASDSIMRLLPASRLLFLARDGRDVLDSLADAMLGESSWWSRKGDERLGRPPEETEAFLRQNARLWRTRTAATWRAYESTLESRRALLRYEDLLAGTERELTRLLDWMELRASPAWIGGVAKRHRFEAVPEKHRGPGKAIRSATPGGWRRRFGPEEAALMESEMAPWLQRLGYRPAAEGEAGHAPEREPGPPHPLDDYAQAFFIHVPKTGGSTLARLLEKVSGEMRRLRPATLRFGLLLEPPTEAIIAGHNPYPVAAALAQPVFVMTMLRDPVARAISAFDHMRREVGSRSYGILEREGIGTVEQAVAHPRLRPQLCDMQTRYLGARFGFDDLLEAVRAGELTEAEAGRRFGGRLNGPLGTEAVDLARERLEAMPFFGITERYEASLRLLSHQTGLELTRSEVRERVAPQAQRAERESRYGPDARELLEGANALDRALYEFALDLFARRYEAAFGESADSG